MAVAIEDVPAWLKLDRGIGHALVSVKSDWHYVVCGTLTPNGEVIRSKPARICKRCRAGLKEIHLTQQSKQQEG